MNILIKDKWYSHREEEETTIPYLFYLLLDGTDYERGVVEATQVQATNNSKAIGRLVEVLLERGVITVDDLNRVADNGRYEVRVKQEGAK